jgi:hypothetical protein
MFPPFPAILGGMLSQFPGVSAIRIPQIADMLIIIHD